MPTRVALIVIALSTAILRCRPIDDPDYHWHLATGRLVVTERAVPAVDPFSHTALGAPWKFVDWIADLLMYGLHRLGGDALVVVAFAIAGAAAIALAGARAARVDARPSVVAPITLLVAGVVAFRITPRPQTLTFLLAAGLLALLDAVRRGERSPWWIPVVVALWQNVHSSGLVGCAIASAYAVAAFFESKTPGAKERARSLAFATLASFGATFLSVRPIDRLAAGFDHLGDPRVSRLFAEWGHAFTPGAFGPWVVAYSVLFALALLGARRARASVGLGPILAASGLTVLGLLSFRFLAIAGLAIAPVAAAGLAIVRDAIRRSAVMAALCVAAAVPLAMQVKRPGLGLAPGAFPERAVEVLRASSLEGRLFNDFHHGGYLLWSLGAPGWPVFVDGRSMALYGIDFVERAVTASGPALDAMLASHDVSIVVLPPDVRVGQLHRSGEWLLVSIDDTAAVLVRARDASEAARAKAYRVVRPTSWFDLSIVRADLATAREEAERAFAEAPDSSITTVLRIAVAIASRDFARADALLEDAARRFPDSTRVARARLMRCLEVDDRDCACAVAAEVERRFPSNTYAKPVRAKLACP